MKDVVRVNSVRILSLLRNVRSFTPNQTWIMCVIVWDELTVAINDHVQLVRKN